jgi:TPP-dependent pyruvate/acetoin dehydrogenase alpha subunit
MVISVWDDDYGISVHAKHQTTKESISEVLAGFAATNSKAGYKILTVKGWDYAQLVATYEEAERTARTEHQPV